MDNGGNVGTLTPLSAPEPFALTIAGQALVYAETNLTLRSLVVASNGTLFHLASQPGLDLVIQQDATVALGGVIQADGRGYAGSYYAGQGPGGGAWGGGARFAGGGGGHGGVGGLGDSGYGGTVAGGSAYGSVVQPATKGSGGGWGGAAGGGAIRLTVGGTLTGTGTLLAIGGNGNVYGGGGAGGRIAVYHTSNLFTGILSAQGGTGYQTGDDGSRYFLSGYLPLVGTGHAPAGTVMYAVSNVDVYFNVAVNPATVTTNDVTITTPGGPIPANQLAVEMLSGTQLRLRFPPQNVPGTYQVQVDPQIEDLYGNAMIQAYGSTFVIAAPLISGTVRDTNGLPVTEVTLQPGGGLGGDLTAINGQYSLPVLASWTGTVTPSKLGWMFVPGARSYTNLTANVTNQDYTLVETIVSALSSRQQGTDCHVEWYGLSGVGYQPQSSTNLVNWADYGSLQNGTNGPLWFNVPITSAPRMFFRIRSNN